MSKLTPIKFMLIGLATAMATPMATAARPADRPVGLVPQGTNVMMVFANAVPGQETAFAAWYDQHMQAIMKLPGFVRVQRFEVQPRQGRDDPPFHYVILYEFNGDPDTIIAALGPAVKEGRLQAPDKRYVLKTEGMVYKAVTPGFMATPAK